jgi:hypothetical protein
MQPKTVGKSLSCPQYADPTILGTSHIAGLCSLAPSAAGVSLVVVLGHGGSHTG